MHRLGSAYPPVAFASAFPDVKETTSPHTILVRAIKQLKLVAVDGVYQQFTCVNHTAQPSVSSACCWQNPDHDLATIFGSEEDYIVRELRTTPLPVMHYP